MYLERTFIIADGCRVESKYLSTCSITYSNNAADGHVKEEYCGGTNIQDIWETYVNTGPYKYESSCPESIERQQKISTCSI